VEFSRLAFGAEPRDDGDSVEGDNDGGDGGPPNAFGAQAIEDVAEDPTGYATVTVDVLTVEVPDHEDAPALKATVKDRSTAIDVISWNDPNALPDEGAFVLENVAVGKTRRRCSADNSGRCDRDPTHPTRRRIHRTGRG